MSHVVDAILLNKNKVQKLEPNMLQDRDPTLERKEDNCNGDSFNIETQELLNEENSSQSHSNEEKKDMNQLKEDNQNIHPDIKESYKHREDEQSEHVPFPKESITIETMDYLSNSDKNNSQQENKLPEKKKLNTLMIDLSDKRKVICATTQKEDDESDYAKYNFLKKENIVSHDQLETISVSTTKATNWSIRMKADIFILQKIRTYLLEQESVKAVKGQIEWTEIPHQNSYLHIMLKYNKPALKSTISRLVTKCSDYSPEAVIVTMHAVKQTEHIKDMLENVWKKSAAMEEHEPFEQGEFKYPRCAKKPKLDASSLIREEGPWNAKCTWAEQQLPRKEYEQALEEYKWQRSVQEEKERRTLGIAFLEHLYPWQEYILKIFKQKPDARSIYVILDKEGGNGKTSLQNALSSVFPEEIVDIKNGPTKDMTWLPAKKGTYKAVQLNLTRQNLNNVNFSAIEMIKDGNFASTKYVPVAIQKNCPHVFVYTNEELQWLNMTTDRWQIIHLCKKYEDTQFKIFNLEDWQNARQFEEI